MRGGRRAAAALAAAGSLLAASPAAAVQVGLADQNVEPFTDPRVAALGLRVARLIVPYDAATAEPQAVAGWLAAVQADGMVPHVAFEHRLGEDCSVGRCTLPTTAQYAAAVRAFVARFPQVRTYTTWNEANHESQPVALHPEAAAAFYGALVGACPGCTIVAGDVLDSGGYRTWLERFEAAAPGSPRLWGLHDYGDVTYGRTTGADTVLATVPGQLWIEETGALVTLRDHAGRVTLGVGETAAATAIDRAFALAAARPRITRMYVYQWRAHPLDRFDAGLVRPDGTTRPAYTTLLRDLRASAPAATPAARATLTPPRFRAAWRGATLAIRVTCRPAGTRCAGRVAAAARLRARAGGKVATIALGTRRYAATTVGGRTTVSIRVSAARRRRIRRARVAGLRLTVRASAPVAGTRALTAALARPR